MSTLTAEFYACMLSHKILFIEVYHAMECCAITATFYSGYSF